MAPTPALSGVPTAQPISPPEPGTPPSRVGAVADDLRDAEHRRDHAEPADDQPAARLGARRPRRSSRSAAKNSTTGSTMTSEPMIQRTPSARPAPTGPMPLLQAAAPSTIARPEHGQADAVPAVLGGERLGLLRAGDRAGQAAGAAGEQVPAAATTRQRPRPRTASCGRRDGGSRWSAWRPAASCSQPSSRSAPREDAGRRVDVVRAGMCRTVIAFGARIRAGGRLVSRTWRPGS